METSAIFSSEGQPCSVAEEFLGSAYCCMVDEVCLGVWGLRHQGLVIGGQESGDKKAAGQMAKHSFSAQFSFGSGCVGS